MKQKTKKTMLWFVMLIGSFVALQVAVYSGILTAFYEITLVNILINVMLAVGLNLVIGISGQFSLGHAGFMAIGAYAAGILTRLYPNYGGLLAGIAVGGVIAFLMALLIGIPTLRLKGDYLAIATLGFSEIIRIAILNLKDLTNGAAGMSGIPYLSNWMIAFAGAAATLVLTVFYVKSNAGRMTLAVREDETAAQSLGVKTTKYKLAAFALGAVTASVAGSIHATYYSVINPDQFGFMRSVDILIIVVFGGMGSLTGSVLSAVLLGFLNIYLQPLGAVRMILYAVILIALMAWRPAGLLGNKELNWDWIFRKSSKRKGPPPSFQVKEEHQR